jgi:hypothetical protein
MSLYFPENHAENPPSTWTVVRVGRQWSIVDKQGVSLETGLRTKHEATERLTDGFAARLWEKERRYYSGEDVPGWKPSPYRQQVAS